MKQHYYAFQMGFFKREKKEELQALKEVRVRRCDAPAFLLKDYELFSA
jgi:hypothetical protein